SFSYTTHDAEPPATRTRSGRRGSRHWRETRRSVRGSRGGEPTVVSLPFLAARSAARAPLARGHSLGCASDLAACPPGTEPSRRARPPEGVPSGGSAPSVRGPPHRTTRVSARSPRGSARARLWSDTVRCCIATSCISRRQESGFRLRARPRNAHGRRRLAVCNNFNPRSTTASPPSAREISTARRHLSTENVEKGTGG